MAGEQRVTLSATGKTSVEIFTTKLDQTFDSTLVHIPLPRQRTSEGFDKSADAYIIDLGRIKNLIAIQGYLVDDSISMGLTKKNDLKALIEDVRAFVTITWGTGANQQTYGGAVQKAMITETPGLIYGDIPTGGNVEKGFAVQVSFIVGTDK